jgi:hypothetical protein
MGREARLRHLGLVTSGGAPLRSTPPKVALGYCFGTLHWPFVKSKDALREYDIQRMARGELPTVHYQIPQAGLYIDHNRNRVVEKFMEADAEWLLQIDTDIEFPPDIVETMLAVAGRDKKILAASVPLGPPLPSCAWMMTEQPGIWRSVPTDHWCPLCRHEGRFLTRCADGFKCGDCGTVYLGSDERITGQMIVSEKPIEVDGLATAVILIHREVFEAIADQVGQCWFLKTMQPRMTEERSKLAWIDKGPVRDRQYISVGEDLSFCLRAADAGFKSWCVKVPGLRHHKNLPMSHDFEAELPSMPAMEAAR